MNSAPLPIPPEILAAIEAAEMKRLNLNAEELCLCDAFGAYFPSYQTGSIGYHGPLAVIVWGSDPSDVNTFILRGDAWELCK